MVSRAGWSAVAAMTVALALAWATGCGPEPSGMSTSEGASAASESGSTGASEETTAAGSTSGADASAGASTGGGETTIASTGAPQETTGACEFICATDIPEGETFCDVFAQDCPEGEKCAGYDSDGDGAWDSSKCVALMGDGQHGEPCTAEGGASGIDTCDKGHMCWNLNEDGVGVCVALCGGTPEDPTCAPDCTSCYISGDGQLNLCVADCDPLAQDCPGSQVCIGVPYQDSFVCVLDASGGMGPAGTPCEFANVCNPGNQCADTTLVPHPACEDAPGCCTPFCDVADPVACAALEGAVPGIECVPYAEELPPCHESVGICVVP